MRALLINEGLDATNWGLQASSQGIINILHENDWCLSFITHAELHKTFLFEPTLFGKRLFNENSRILNKLTEPYFQFPETSDEYEFYYELWRAGKGGSVCERFMDAMTAVDIVVFNAEGSTYKKNHGALRGLFMLYMARRLGKRALFVNGSFTITSVDNVLSGIARQLYHQGAEFYVREGLSRNCLSRIGVSSRVIPDSVFYYATGKRLKKHDTFAVSKSMLPMCKCSMEKDAFFNLINRIHRETSLYPVFYAKDPEDLMMNKYVSLIRGSKMVGSDIGGFQEVQREMSKSQFLLSGRYHHLIFAANTGTQVCPMSSSSHKIEGLMQLLDEENPPVCHDPTNLDMDSSIIVGKCVSLTNQDAQSWDPLSLKEQLLSSYKEVLK